MMVDSLLFFLLFGIITGCVISILLLMHEAVSILRWLKRDRIINLDFEFLKLCKENDEVKEDFKKFLDRNCTETAENEKEIEQNPVA